MADKIDLNSITVDIFCDLNGVDNNNRNLMKKLHKKRLKSYDQWHALLSKDFKLHPKKDFTPAKKASPVASTEKSTKK